LNTIIYDDEIPDMEKLSWELYEAGVDAFIVQDLAFFKMKLPPIPLHASTQMDNRSTEKVQWLYGQGFSQIVLARELSLQEIAAIHRTVPEATLEVFVHGALCVSYSGQCYASQHCFGRSANRGECAQFCRLPYSLVDATGTTVVADRYLLSLKDMCRSDSLEQMMDAGVRSFKIEGRLKDVAYVKNVTAFYRQQIDAILSRREEYQRAAYGTSTFHFQPDLRQSFSRGYTDYFLSGRASQMASWDSPKSLGQEVGVVKEVRHGCIVVSGVVPLGNGDGLCFKDKDSHIRGFRVNRVEGNHIYPAQMPAVSKGDTLWRSYHHAWERMMEGKTAERKMLLRWLLTDTEEGFSLRAEREDGVCAERSFVCARQLAQKDQYESISQVLCKLGDTVYQAGEVAVRLSQPWFIPRSVLAEWRRAVVEALPMPRHRKATMQGDASHQSANQLFTNSYLLNVSNRLSAEFYQSMGVDGVQPALELQPRADATLMFCKYCIQRELGWCPRQGGRSPYQAPFHLLGKDGRRFRLYFDCKACQMTIKQENFGK
ncbi:MAG: U32 family peptidase, partial [Bacteroidaceae bacterium]|nr:U32 family peptidase [Bacteroidaceae bacterium]